MGFRYSRIDHDWKQDALPNIIVLFGYEQYSGVSTQAFKIRREYLPVTLMTASLLSTILKTWLETFHYFGYLKFVNSHFVLTEITSF